MRCGVRGTVEGGGDADSDYNDVQWLDSSSGTLNGAVSGGADQAMNSSAAINDNLLNSQIQRDRYADTLNERSLTRLLSLRSDCCVFSCCSVCIFNLSSVTYFPA